MNFLIYFIVSILTLLLIVTLQGTYDDVLLAKSLDEIPKI